MSTFKLPDRPSLESLRKQAKKLARGITAGDADAVARARAQLPKAELPLSHRDVQLVLAREYGFRGWQHLLKEVNQRLDKGLGWAISRARAIIHDNDIEGLRELLAEYPALLSWTADDEDGGLLGIATESYGDSFNPMYERHFTRKECAELLLDAGAVVTPSVCDGLVASRARGLLDLFHRRDLLPRSLKFFAALGDVDAIRAHLDSNSDNLATVNQAFMTACVFQHTTAAELLLNRSIMLDAELGRKIDNGPGRSAFMQYFAEHKPDFTDDASAPLWQTFVIEQVGRALHDGDLKSFVDGLQRERWMLSDPWVKLQVRLIDVAVLNDRGAFIKALLDLDPAVLHRSVPPPSQTIEFAFTYAKTHLLPMLLRIWPMPDDLPHAAGNGDFARVKSWFNAEGQPAPGNIANHAPATSVHPREAEWGDVGVQQVLDTALAWAVLNNHFEIADFLLQHGADINTNWSSHEPASILHELVWYKNYEAMQFLIDRGIDMTILDYRWNATAEGWARHAAHDEKMAQWLREAQQRRELSVS